MTKTDMNRLYRPDPTAPGAVIMNVPDNANNWLKSKKDHTLESELLGEIRNFPGANEDWFNGSMRFNEPTLLFNYKHLRDKLDDLVERKLIIEHRGPDEHDYTRIRYFISGNDRDMHRVLILDDVIRPHPQGISIVNAIRQGANATRMSKEYVRKLLRDLVEGSEDFCAWIWLDHQGFLHDHSYERPSNLASDSKVKKLFKEAA